MSRTIGMALASALVLAQSVQADDALDIHSGPQFRLIWETSPADEDEKREAPAGHVVEDATDPSRPPPRNLQLDFAKPNT